MFHAIFLPCLPRHTRISLVPQAMHKVNVGERTPDARLPVPLLIRGRPVFWIDSKADFGSSYMHQRNLSQLGSYCMRFKQGLVIYW